MSRGVVPKKVDDLRGVDRVFFDGAGERRGAARLDERVAERDRSAERPSGEVGEHVQRVEELALETDQSRVEEVRLEEAQASTSWRRPETCALQGERLPVAEEVRLLDLRGGDEVLDRCEKPAPTWKVPVGFSATSKLTMILSGVRALLGRDVDALEVPERRDAPLDCARGFVSLKSCASSISISRRSDLVARLGVPLHLDALDVDERAAPDGDDDVDLLVHRIELGLGLGLDVGVAGVAVERADAPRGP